MTFKLRHKETGLFAIGTFDRIPGCAYASEFNVNDSGELVPDYEGETDVWWDQQEPETDPMNSEIFLVDEENNVCTISEFEQVPVDEVEVETAEG